MNVEKTEDEVIVKLDGQKISYIKDEWTDEKTFLSSEGAVEFEEWKIDLIKNYGVDKNEF